MDKIKVECIDCDGTGLIEGQEWNGEKCRVCHGTGWVEAENDEWMDDERYDEHRPTYSRMIP